MSMRTGALVVLTGLTVACSSSTPPAPALAPPGTATIDTTLTFMPAHSWASAAATTGGAGQTSFVVTSLAGGTDECLAVNLGRSTANDFQVTVSLDGSPKPGTFELGDGWTASYVLSDANCKHEGQTEAIAGTLEIDSVGTSVNGVADMTFSTGRVIANFSAPQCEVAATPPACTPVASCPAGHGADVTPPASACLASP
jgi:hypothetical protein